jgi:hypothetical protein
MPCLAIHLAVAKKYLENHNEDKNEFILGTIAPDINLPDIDKYINGTSEDKKSHHFGNSIETNSLIEYMKNKVNFNLFFSYNDINTSFAKAYFLHLLCDYYFFGDYIKDERLKNLSLRDAIKVGYNDYNLITPILINKYGLEVPDQVKDMMLQEGQGELQILDLETVYKFIDEMSSLNLEDEKIKRTSEIKSSQL